MRVLCVFVAVCGFLVEANSNTKGAFEQILDVNLGKGQSPHGHDDLFEGDIKLNSEQKLNRALYGDPDGIPDSGRAATNVDKIKWPNGIVYYEFDCSVANMDRAIRTTMEAIAEWESKTCLRFKKRTNETNYIWFHRGNGCWSEVGVQWGRETWLSIGDGCDYKHVMVHELGHSIGFWHEQSRPDRDSYLKINKENIIAGLEYNFEKKKWNTEVIDYGVPYDYSSIMHYPWTAFSKNGKKTLEPIRPLNGKTPYVKLSDDDALQARRMYKCPNVRRPSRPKRAAEPCADVAAVSKCEGWKKTGLCLKHEALLYWCKKTCDFCSSDTCMDLDFSCKSWAQSGKCDSDPQMKSKCRYTCGFCGGGGGCTCSSPPPPTQGPVTQAPPTQPPVTHGPTRPPPTGTRPPSNNFAVGLRCLDKRKSCPDWAKRGDCVTNGWIEITCRISCKTRCDAVEPKPAGSCANPLGLGWEFKGLPDSAFTASSIFRPGGGWEAGPNNARLYFEDDHSSKRIGAWCGDKRENQWLKIDLGRRKRLTGIATQGRDVFHEHVKQYRLQFSDNGLNWKDYKENGKVKVFTGNCDHFTPVLNRFNEVVARYVKIIVVKSSYPCMRVELYGC